MNCDDLKLFLGRHLDWNKLAKLVPDSYCSNHWAGFCYFVNINSIILVEALSTVMENSFQVGVAALGAPLEHGEEKNQSKTGLHLPRRPCTGVGFFSS